MPVRAPHTLAPGARVAIRDEEWMVRAQKPASFGGFAVHVVGLSELVRGKESIFLSELDDVRELLAEETVLVADTSSRYRRARLYLEALLRRTPPTDEALVLGHRAAIRPTQFQLQPAARALSLPRPRLLFADGVGLGKTIEVGILLSELIRRGRGERILVVALKSILAQFQQELWSRFAIPLVRLDSIGIQRVQSRIPEGMNPFYHYSRAIISIDTLKKDAKYRRYLEGARWDVIVIDECQNVAVRADPGSSRMSDRARLAQLLARTTEALILTSATPHDGSPPSFASLIRLLEPTAVADVENYGADEVKDYFLRRFKKDIRHELEEAFPDRSPNLVKRPASPTEDAVFERLRVVEFRTIRRVSAAGEEFGRRSRRSGRVGPGRGEKGVLFRTLLLKSFLSSPSALIETIDHRLKKLEGAPPDASTDASGGGQPAERKADPAAIEHDRRVLTELRALAAQVRPTNFSKYQHLLAWLREQGFDRKGNRERVVIFSERIATLRFLEAELRRELQLSPEALEVFHGSLDDQAQMELVQGFGVEGSPLRVLLASDAASEGINLHFQCHRLVHFDLPWSLITLEQRNGRIDRFGQTKRSELVYLLTIPADEGSKGDLRVLERLIQKENEAHRTLGDVSWLLNLHEAELEEERIAEGLSEGEAPETIIPDEPVHSDFTDILFGAQASSEPQPEVREPVRLFADDVAYAREALAVALGDEHDQRVDWHDHLKGFTLRLPDDLRRRFAYLPVELTDGGDTMKLTADRALVMTSLEAARKTPGCWPEWQLLWELHPVAEWLDDRVLGEFHRHEAPVLTLARGLDGDERVFLFQGVVSNQRSRPVLTDWFGVSFGPHGEARIRHLQELIQATGLSSAPSNPGQEIGAMLVEQLGKLRAPAVQHAREHMLAHRRERATAIGAPLIAGLKRLQTWHERVARLREERRELLLAKGATMSRPEEKRLERERQEADRIYAEYRRWIDEGMRTAEEPYLRLAAVLVKG
jgi:superfamily II DNA or RNA helicase/predicted nucleic acid-binding protein